MKNGCRSTVETEGLRRNKFQHEDSQGNFQVDEDDAEEGRLEDGAMEDLQMVPGST